MLRCTIEILPFGNEDQKKILGIVEIANTGTGTETIGNYRVILKKTPPFAGALKTAWRNGKLQIGRDDEEAIVGAVDGFHRQKRGVYDLLWLALKSCGLEVRNRTATVNKDPAA